MRGLIRMGERRWDVVLDRDQRILLPEDDPVSALQRVAAIDAAQDMMARDLTIVDMRNPARPTVRLAAPATRPRNDLHRLAVIDGAAAIKLLPVRRPGNRTNHPRQPGRIRPAQVREVFRRNELDTWRTV